MAEYQIRLKDHDGAQVAVFTGTGRVTGGLIRASFYKQVRYPGFYTLALDGNDERIDLFDLDYQVEFWRRDRAGEMSWYNVFEGFHRSEKWQQDESGHDQFTSEGQHYNVLLMAETIRWPAGSSQAEKSGPAETVAKEFVDENVGPGATSPPRSRSGVMPGLTVEADAGTGATWDGARASKNLLDVLVEVADRAPADFMVVGTGAAAFEFQWRAGQWGDDKTRDNTDGNVPVVFSPLLGNARNVYFEHNRINEVNVVDVLGQGEGELREVVTVTSGTEDDSPWGVRAVARDQRNVVDTDELTRAGEETLEAQGARIATTIEVMQTTATRFGRDWDLGDLVTVEYRGNTVTQKIIGIKVILETDGTETLEVEMEEP